MEMNFEDRKKLITLLEAIHGIPYAVGVIYGWYENNHISLDEEIELLSITDPDSEYDDLERYWLNIKEGKPALASREQSGEGEENDDSFQGLDPVHKDTFDFGNANVGQQKAITTIHGPVLIIAGPGTGKTFTLVQRTVYLIQREKVQPENIVIATFTDKAANELKVRICTELEKKAVPITIEKLHIGTFHALCLNIINEHLSLTRLKNNYHLIDAFDQQFIVLRNIYRFKHINNIALVMPNADDWLWAKQICQYVNILREELVDEIELSRSQNPAINAIAEVLTVYKNLLEEENLLDFSAIQTECYTLLSKYPYIVEQYTGNPNWLMVDEFQDSNYIQEEIVFLLAGHGNNICVVGDDDQGLYRFRGATIRNILEFPQRFPGGECTIIKLLTNYRSNENIINFYNHWMNCTSGIV